MESLRGSSYTGQGFEDAVVLALKRMGFTVRHNVLLDSAGQAASAELTSQWVAFVLLKEFKKGNREKWWQHFGRDPSRSEWYMPRPAVTEVDVLAEIANFEGHGNRYCGFSLGGIQLRISDFHGKLNGRWLVEIWSSGDSLRKRDKTAQLRWLLRHAASRQQQEGVALFYNGQDPMAAPPASMNLDESGIVMMHFLPSMVGELPEAILRDALQERDQALEEKDHALEKKDHALEKKDHALHRALVEETTKTAFLWGNG